MNEAFLSVVALYAIALLVYLILYVVKRKRQPKVDYPCISENALTNGNWPKAINGTPRSRASDVGSDRPDPQNHPHQRATDCK